MSLKFKTMLARDLQAQDVVRGIGAVRRRQETPDIVFLEFDDQVIPVPRTDDAWTAQVVDVDA